MIEMNRVRIFLVGLLLVSAGMGYASEREFLMQSGIFTNNTHPQLSLTTTTTSNPHPDTANDRQPHPDSIDPINTFDALHLFNNIKTLARQCKKAKPKKKE